MIPAETGAERATRIRNLIADVQQARDYVANIPESVHVVRECDTALVRLRAFLAALQTDR